MYAASDGLHIIQPNGSNDVHVPGTSPYDYAPFWSPDGSTIVFVSTETGNLDLFLISPDGTGRRNLTQNFYADEAPAWEPVP